MTKKRATPPATMKYNLEEAELRESLAEAVQCNAVLSKQLAEADWQVDSLRKQVEAGMADKHALREAIDCNKRLTDQRDTLVRRQASIIKSARYGKLLRRAAEDALDAQVRDNQNLTEALRRARKDLQLYKWGFWASLLVVSVTDLLRWVL